MDLATGDQGARHRIGRAARTCGARRRRRAWTSPGSASSSAGARRRRPNRSPSSGRKAPASVRRPGLSPSGRRTVPPPSPGPPGTGLGLGMEVDARRSTRSPVSMSRGRPTGPSGRLMRPGSTPPTTIRSRWSGPVDPLPDTTAPGVGLIEMPFRGKIDEGWFKKIVGPDEVEPVTVNGHRGFWISGEPHQFFYEGPERLRRRAAPLGRRCPPLVRRSDHVPARDVARTRCGHRHRESMR